MSAILKYLVGYIDPEYASLTSIVNFIAITLGEKLLYGDFSLYHAGVGALLPFATSFGLYGLNRLTDYLGKRRNKR
jgi:hypothetical protein